MPASIEHASYSSGHPALEVRDLTKHYPIKSSVLRRTTGLVKAVDGVSFRLEPGQTLGIVGESGCGKSSLARCIVGLTHPTSGSVHVQGRDISDLSFGEMRPYRDVMQMVFQDPFSSLNPKRTVGEILAEPFKVRGQRRGNYESRIRQLLDDVGLPKDALSRYPHEFSGGQRQRIVIARALTVDPAILVLDEPVAALDVSIQAQILNLLIALREERGLSYVIIAHDVTVVRHIADNVAVMYLGKFVEEGPGGVVLDEPLHPYTQALLSAVPRVGPHASRLGSRRIILAGDVPNPAAPPIGCNFRTRCWKAEAICVDDEPGLGRFVAGDHSAACHFAAPLGEAHTRPIAHPSELPRSEGSRG